mgnify:CR=1 FL=1
MLFTLQEENRIKELVREVLRENLISEINESTLAFFDTIPDMQNHFVATTYEMYDDFCKSRNITPISKQAFGSSVKNYYNVKSKVTTFDGKSVRIYTK